MVVLRLDHRTMLASKKEMIFFYSNIQDLDIEILRHKER